MKLRLIGMLSTALIIPITVLVSTIFNGLQTLVHVPVWLSSLVGTLLLAGWHFVWAINREEDEKHADTLRKHQQLTHRNSCSGGRCPHPELHNRSAFKPQVRRPNA